MRQEKIDIKAADVEIYRYSSDSGGSFNRLRVLLLIKTNCKRPHMLESWMGQCRDANGPGRTGSSSVDRANGLG